MTFERLELFDTKGRGFLVFGFLALIFFLHVAYRYYDYKQFLALKNPLFEGNVLLAYDKVSKRGKTYKVLKVATAHESIYTISWQRDFKVNSGDRVSFKIIQKNVSFLDFLSKRFYAPSFDLRVYENKSFHLDLRNFIENQHENKQMASLYSALFLATPIDKNLRQKIQNWGISHLVAISGFHLGVIYGALFFIFKYLYGFFQSRFFPYRDLRFDLGIFIFAILAIYAYIIDFTPSFLRAYVMGLLGFFLFIRYFRVLSFLNLALSVAFLIAFFPHLALSIGFWFSVSGVFYIFLYLHHFGFRWWDGLFINIWVFLCMIIPVHFYFPYISYQQFGAIILSLIFVVFYPFAFFLHLVGFGDLLDVGIIKLLNISFEGSNIQTPLWFLCVYIILSLLGILNRYLALAVASLGILYFFLI
ncbi:MAG: competence protein [Proteobacteria bacterium]|nr:MAG: competence protein [Pseudomonadota bacterium]